MATPALLKQSPKLDETNALLIDKEASDIFDADEVGSIIADLVRYQKARAINSGMAPVANNMALSADKADPDKAVAAMQETVDRVKQMGISDADLLVVESMESVAASRSRSSGPAPAALSPIHPSPRACARAGWA